MYRHAAPHDALPELGRPQLPRPQPQKRRRLLRALLRILAARRAGASVQPVSDLEWSLRMMG